MTMLQVQGVHKDFGGLRILTDVSFSAEPGEKLALIGPNGAGKTTLINVIGGQMPASSGHVFIDGKPVVHMGPHRRLHRGLGRSFQVNNLFFELPVLDNVLLSLYGGERHSHFDMVRKIDRRPGIMAEAERLLDLVGLWDVRSEPLYCLSYGDQRLVELLSAFTANPKVVLLDEPSAGLPTAEAFAFADIIRKLSADITLLFCAHDMDLVFDLADTIMVLYFGRIIAKGLPKEISGDPKVQEIYLGSEEERC